MAILGYLAKLKGGLGLAFGAHFLHDFLYKCSIFNALLMDKVTMSQPHFFLKISNKMYYQVLI